MPSPATSGYAKRMSSVSITNAIRSRSLETHRRTLLKTMLYRVLMILVTILVAFIIIGDVTDSVNIGIAANLLKTGTYYGYERVWSRIEWGV